MFISTTRPIYVRYRGVKGPRNVSGFVKKRKIFFLFRGSGLASERTFRTPIYAPTAVSTWCEMQRNVCYRLDVSVSSALSVTVRPFVRNHCWEYTNHYWVEFRLIYLKIRCDAVAFGNRNHSFAEKFWTVLLFLFLPRSFCSENGDSKIIIVICLPNCTMSHFTRS